MILTQSLALPMQVAGTAPWVPAGYHLRTPRGTAIRFKETIAPDLSEKEGNRR